ncbi:MAG: class I SAM-dependent methyltransferase [Planctomycetota bacterium]
METFLADCQISDIQNKRILEIGFGNGLFLEQCQKAGLAPTGLEVREDLYKNAKSRYPDMDLILYDGLKIPLPDESFDFVVSYQVLEHAGAIKDVLAECIRILKPGGIIYHVCPNNFSFYEGHYKIIWLPFLSKSSGRLYLKMLGRYTPYYESLNILKPWIITAVLRRFEGSLKLISLGKREFIDKFNLEQIEKVDQKLLKNILKLVLRFSLLKKLILRVICWLNLYYPITIIAVKTGKDSRTGK